MDSPECDFCRISAEGLPAHGLYEDEQFFVMLDRNSLGLGHCMIIPRVHVGAVEELDPDSYQRLFALAARLSPRLKAATGRRAIGFVAFGLSPHAHLHLVPMDDSDVLERPEPRRLEPHTLAQQAAGIRSFFENF